MSELDKIIIEKKENIQKILQIVNLLNKDDNLSADPEDKKFINAMYASCINSELKNLLENFVKIKLSNKSVVRELQKIALEAFISSIDDFNFIGFLDSIRIRLFSSEIISKYTQLRKFRKIIKNDSNKFTEEHKLRISNFAMIMFKPRIEKFYEKEAN